MDSLRKFKQKCQQRLFPVSQQQALLQDIAALIEDGVSANHAIQMMSRITKGRTASVVDAMLLAISKGEPIAVGMQGWYPPHIVEMVRAGQEGGTLVAAMQSAAESLGFKSGAITALVNSLTYPIAVLCLGLGVVVFINHSILADFQTILPLRMWPLHSQYLVALANFIQHWAWLAILLLSLLVVGVMYLLPNYVGNLRYSLDRIPLLSLYREFLAARFMETLGMLVANGLVLKRALEVLKSYAHPYFAAHLLAMEYRLGTGFESIGEVLDTGLINDADILRLRLIVKDSRFESALQRLGKQAAKKAQAKVIRDGKVLGTVLMFVSAGLAFLMIFSIYDVGSILGNGV